MTKAITNITLVEAKQREKEGTFFLAVQGVAGGNGSTYTAKNFCDFSLIALQYKKGAPKSALYCRLFLIQTLVPTRAADQTKIWRYSRKS